MVLVHLHLQPIYRKETPYRLREIFNEHIDTAAMLPLFIDRIENNKLHCKLMHIVPCCQIFVAEI